MDGELAVFDSVSGGPCCVKNVETGVVDMYDSVS